jgi:hypothetical protein
VSSACFSSLTRKFRLKFTSVRCQNYTILREFPSQQSSTPMAGSCKFSNESSRFIKRGNLENKMTTTCQENSASSYAVCKTNPTYNPIHHHPLSPKQINVNICSTRVYKHTHTHTHTHTQLRLGPSCWSLPGPKHMKRKTLGGELTDPYNSTFYDIKIRPFNHFIMITSKILYFYNIL